MTASIFPDKTHPPTGSDLEQSLGETAAFLHEIEQFIRENCGELTTDWKYYSRRAGWTMTLAYKGRTLLHLIPHSGYFTAIFILGARAAALARERHIPAEYLAAIENAREYAEGRSIRFDVESASDAEIVKELISIKLS